MTVLHEGGIFTGGRALWEAISSENLENKKNKRTGGAQSKKGTNWVWPSTPRHKLGEKVKRLKVAPPLKTIPKMPFCEEKTNKQKHQGFGINGQRQDTKNEKISYV